ncbi:MAG TPA: glycosyltransferase [Acetobacteraceae bacterium]|nr:glycosyltransferase [Acetobacteraceae bacterium]
MSEHVAGAPGAPPRPYDTDVVILALDRAEATVAAILSVLAQAGVTKHLFVVDQGSRPENLARLAACVTGHPDATLVSLGRNYGVAGGRNRGTSLGHGRVIVGLDNDAEFATTDTLSLLVHAVDAEPNLAAVGCRILCHGGGDDLSSWGYARRLLPHAGESFRASTFVGAGHAIRRRAWDDIGGYDEALFFCWEELDFCQRAIARGWSVRYRGDIEVRHKVSAEQRVAWSGTRWFWFMRNRLYVGRKHGESWLSLLPRIAWYLMRAGRDHALWGAFRGMAEATRMTPARITASAPQVRLS